MSSVEDDKNIVIFTKMEGIAFLAFLVISEQDWKRQNPGEDKKVNLKHLSKLSSLHCALRWSQEALDYFFLFQWLYVLDNFQVIISSFWLI